MPRTTLSFLYLLTSTVRLTFFCLTVSVVLAGGDKPDPSDNPRLQAVLKLRCLGCHGVDNRKAELDLSSLAGILQGGESGPAVNFLSPAESLLVEYVTEGVMPPPEAGTLSDEETATIVQWVRDVAAYQSRKQPKAVSQHDVLPVLLLRCAACHGRTNPQAALDVRSRAALLAGGKSGPAIVPGQPADSLLLQRVHAGDMPPRKRLVSSAVKPMTAHEIDRVTRWIAAGAPEIDLHPDIMTTEPDSLVSDADRDFWAFQTPTTPDVPAVANAERVLTPIDAFILQPLEDRGLPLSPPATRATLIRRATFNLLGLPPTPAEIDTFVADDRPHAWRLLIDRLLDSPHYGERWAQHWLDSAGYSDSEGVQHADPVRKHAWRYRDYVIRALNDDKPYDRFLLEQLAGDELADYESAAEVTQELYDNLVATGFLRLAPDGTFEPLTGFVPDRLELIDDELEILSSTVMGLTIKCARCHSHKFDPIPQRDYYRLAAIFKGALDEHDWLKPDGRRLPFVTSQERRRWQDAGSKPADQPWIRALWDRGQPSPVWLLRRGNYLTTGRPIGPGVPSVLTDGRTPLSIQPPWPGSDKTGRRLAFAKWLTQHDHPLTSRVMVNRIWKHHFGTGLVRTLDNFGRAGARPSHPELLDWLATEFVKSDWSIKHLHRLILNSAVYRQSSLVIPAHQQLDSDNVLLSRMPLRRMEGEVVRDALLAVADRLNRTPFGPPDAVTVRADGLVTSEPYSNSDRWRRSIYLLKRRTQPVTLLQDFDVSRMDPNCVARRESIVAPQALHLTNNQWVRQMSEAFSRRVRRQAGADRADQIRLAWRLAAGRPPDTDELAASMQAIEKLRQQWLEHHPGTRHEFAATVDLWIRESEPDRVFEDDLVSVWSRGAGDGSRRCGLLEFTIHELEGLNLTHAELQLAATQTQTYRQFASVIPPGIEQYNWAQYQQRKAPHSIRLERLGSVTGNSTQTSDSRYTVTESATAADLRQIASAVTTHGQLTLVLEAAEDGAVYQRDWDDGEHTTSRQLPPRLIVYDTRPDTEQASRRALHDFCHGLINSAAFLYID